MKKILITGANSYIGTKFKDYITKKNQEYSIDTLDMKSSTWEQHDFSKYDVVFHVAGIAHVNKGKSFNDTYMKINRDLAIKTALKAKESGVKQFIFMSSMIIYGKDKNYKDKTVVNENMYAPSNSYGQSKLEADLFISRLNDSHFKTVIVRTPMVYGPNSKGNFKKLQKIALKLPIFPNINNQRSMIYIDNLCRFLYEYITKELSGLFYPQNLEYVATKDIIKQVRIMNGKKYRETKLFNWLILLISFIIPTINKVFGNKIYQKNEFEIKDELVSFESSMKRIHEEENNG